MGFLTGFATGAFGAISEGLDNIAEEEKKRAAEERAEERAIDAFERERIMREKIAKMKTTSAEKVARIGAEATKASVTQRRKQFLEQKQIDFNKYNVTLHVGKDKSKLSYKADATNPAREMNTYLSIVNTVDQKTMDEIDSNPVSRANFLKAFQKGLKSYLKAEDFGAYLPDGQVGVGQQRAMFPRAAYILDPSVITNSVFRKSKLFREGFQGVVDTIERPATNENTAVIAANSVINTASKKDKDKMINFAVKHMEFNPQLYSGGNVDRSKHRVLRDLVKLGLPVPSPENEGFYNVPVGFREYVRSGGTDVGNKDAIERWLMDKATYLDPATNEVKQKKHAHGFVKTDQNGKFIGLTEKGLTLFRIYSPDNGVGVQGDPLTEPKIGYLNERKRTFSQWRKTSSEGKIFDHQLKETAGFNRSLNQTQGLIKKLRTVMLQSNNAYMTSVGKGILKALSFGKEAFTDVRNIFTSSSAINRAFGEHRIIDFEGKNVLHTSKGVATELKTKLDIISADADSLAKREALEYLLAYQLSSIFQGGSGGRTISDADVKIYMKVLSSGYTGKEAYINKLDMLSEILEFKREDTALFSKLIRSDLEGTLNGDAYQSYKAALEFNRSMRNASGEGNIGDLLVSGGNRLDPDKFNRSFERRNPNAVSVHNIHRLGDEKLDMKNRPARQGLASKLAEYSRSVGENISPSTYMNAINTLFNRYNTSAEREVMSISEEPPIYSVDPGSLPNLTLRFVGSKRGIARASGEPYKNLTDKSKISNMINIINNGVDLINASTGKLETRYMVPASYYSVEDRSKYKFDVTAIDNDTDFKPVTKPEFDEFYKAVLVPFVEEATKVESPASRKKKRQTRGRKGRKDFERTFGRRRAEGGIIFPTKKLFTLSQERN